MLAAIEQDQRALRLRVQANCFNERRSRDFYEAQDPSQGIDHERWVVDRIDIDVPDAVRVAVDDTGGELEQEPRLAYAAGADEREEARLRKQLRKSVQLPLATDEGRDLLGQIVRRGFQRSQRWKVLSQLWVNDLKNMLDLRQVA